MPGLAYLPAKYGDCFCECHHFGGISHIAPCCYPEPTPAPITAALKDIKGLRDAMLRVEGQRALEAILEANEEDVE
jgi:hypothetical protein